MTSKQTLQGMGVFFMGMSPLAALIMSQLPHWSSLWPVALVDWLGFGILFLFMASRATSIDQVVIGEKAP